MNDVNEAKIIDRIQKLLTLAQHAATPEAEAATAAALAQQLLTAYNLDIATVEKKAGTTSGARGKESSRASMAKYERDLWHRVAELNFCHHIVVRAPGLAKKTDGMGFRHDVIGRIVNVRSTQIMASYLLQTIDRLCREWMAERSMGNNQYFKREAVAYREGMADRLCDRLYERRREEERERARKAAEQRAKEPSGSTALTIADISQAERQANADFMTDAQFGAGTAARWKAEAAERQVQREKALAELAAWEKAHPEEAAAKKRAKAEEDKAFWEKWNKKQRNRKERFRQPSNEEIRRSSREFHEGRRAGDKVGLYPQVDTGSKRPMLGSN